MSSPAIALFVRFHSALSYDDVVRVAEERIEDFRALEGLQQKYYIQDPATGEYGGFYLWRSPEDLDAYRQSELRASIGQAYQVEGEPRVEVFRVVATLRE